MNKDKERGVDSKAEGLAEKVRGVRSTELTPEEKVEKRSILKNVIVVSIAFTFLFTSYNSNENLQSSLNQDSGTTSLAALYAGFLFSGCFLTSLLLKRLGEKHTLAVCSLCYAAYMAAQSHPKLYLLMPTAILAGLAAAAIWSAKGTYITKVGHRYAQITGEESSAVITRFFTIFYMFYQSTQVWGNLLSSAVLSVDVNVRLNTSIETPSSCGYHFCIKNAASLSNVDSNRSIDDALDASNSTPPDWQIYTLTGAYVAGTVISSLIILIFLDPIKRYREIPCQSGKEEKTILQLLVATFSHLRHPYQLLLVPLTIWSGVERAFLGADFTAAYVSCALGIHMVGYVMICYGACDVVGAMSASTLVKLFGRVPVIAFALLINAILIGVLIYWKPHPDAMVWFFVISGLWGFADGLWQTQINSLYGVLFTDNAEAAFSNCRLWEATGFTIAFACSSALCISSKISIVTTFLVLGVTGYYIIEIAEKVKRSTRARQGDSSP